MDSTEPPRIVVEASASCADSARVEELLRRELAPARTPGPAWIVTMRVDRPSPATRSSAVRAEGEIVDGDGVRIARRVVSGERNRAGDCEGLARAVGVWASLVLDAERSRADASSQAKMAPPIVASTDGPENTPWPAPMAIEPRLPEHDWYLHHDDHRTLEFGVGAFLMTGAAGGPMAGATPYFLIEAGRGVFLRPSLLFGATLTSFGSSDNASPPSADLAAARFDACARLPGLYMQDHGIQLDMCAGGDVGITLLSAPFSAPSMPVSNAQVLIPFVSLGPSVDLRGELGSALAISIRGIAGINATAGTWDGFTQPSWSGRIEVALSWRLK